MSEKKQKKAKIIKTLHTAADKTGKIVRKVGPWIGGAAAAAFVFIVSGGKNSSSKS